MYFKVIWSLILDFWVIRYPLNVLSKLQFSTRVDRKMQKWDSFVLELIILIADSCSIFKIQLGKNWKYFFKKCNRTKRQEKPKKLVCELFMNVVHSCGILWSVNNSLLNGGFPIQQHDYGYFWTFSGINFCTQFCLKMTRFKGND